MSNVMCGVHDDEYEGCRNNTHALFLKMIAIAAILTAGICGVGIPLVGKKSRFLRTDSNLFVAAKAFAGGVILATGFVHMLPDATSALTDSCLPQFPWSKFPFSGFIAMMGALATLLAEFVGTQYHERKQEKQSHSVQADMLDSESNSGMIPVEGKGDSIHIVEVDEDAQCHVHPNGNGECKGKLRENSHSHFAGNGDEDDEARHAVVSQVLELGIVSHSFIIGLSLGVSHSSCTVRPLIGALSFHQFFEGLALGSCISQAKFRTLRSTIMASIFSLTAPAGIAVGIGISSIYNADSPRALVTEGIFDSISAGILVYMALVDLIAADFLHKRMSCSVRLHMVSYIALLVGAVSMSSLAVWA
ncbi:hypothetical protein ACS0TY_022076 [Phlomoides rotata]